MSEHIVEKKVYFLVWFALMVGTGLTVFAAFQNMGVFNPIIALVIATTKAILVVLFFMHVWYSSRMTKLTVFLGVFFLSILLTLTLSDYISRTWLAQ